MNCAKCGKPTRSEYCYQHSEKGIAKRREAQARYEKSEKGKQRLKSYRERENAKKKYYAEHYVPQIDMAIKNGSTLAVNA